MITAKEMLDKISKENNEATSVEMIVYFARIHVKEALKMAYFNHKINTFNGHNESIIELDEDSILKAYDLSKII